MPSELSKYIQDFIRPYKPVTEDIKIIYQYFVELEQRMGEQFRYKIGMTLKIKDKQYKCFMGMKTIKVSALSASIFSNNIFLNESEQNSFSFSYFLLILAMKSILTSLIYS